MKHFTILLRRRSGCGLLSKPPLTFPLRSCDGQSLQILADTNATAFVTSPFRTSGSLTLFNIASSFSDHQLTAPVKGMYWCAVNILFEGPLDAHVGVTLHGTNGHIVGVYMYVDV